MAINSRYREWAILLKDIREEIIGLLCNRYIFRTVQEIIRRNEALQNYPGAFNQWTQVVYAIANGVGVRRLASQSCDDNDVSLVRLLGLMMQDAGTLWDSFSRHFQADLAVSCDRAKKQVSNDDEQCRVVACKRLIGEDRKRLLNATAKVVHFADKRAAHKNPTFKVQTNFADLDKAIDTIKDLAEKYTLVVYGRKHDLLEEMIQRKLRQRWNEIFLRPWATSATLALQLGEMTPPEKPTRR